MLHFGTTFLTRMRNRIEHKIIHFSNEFFEAKNDHRARPRDAAPTRPSFLYHFYYLNYNFNLHQITLSQKNIRHRYDMNDVNTER